MHDPHIMATEIEERFGVSRRTFMRAVQAAAVAGGGALAAAAYSSPNANAASSVLSGSAGSAGSSTARTRVVLLGTAGGPILTESSRMGVSTAIVYEDRVYVVDLGHGSHMNLYKAGLAGAGDANAFSRFRGIFFTHLHSDHTVEWPGVFATSVTNTAGGAIGQPIKVFGPGDRTALPLVNPPGAPEPALVNPERPMPGIAQMTSYIEQAFATDLNDRIRDNNSFSPSRLFDINEIDISPYWTVDESGIPPQLPAGTRIPVWEDGEVRVTATLVDHRPTAPAFAYRFDTPDGSVVVSGDTCPSPNLIDLAQGVDYLVHEAIDEQYVERLVAGLPAAFRDGVRNHLLQSHTTIDQVGRLAQDAGAKNLVLTHLVPATTPDSRWAEARRNFRGNLHVGTDLMSLGIE